MATASMRNCIFVCYNETCDNCFPKKEEPKNPTKKEIEHRRRVIAAIIKHAKSLNW